MNLAVMVALEVSRRTARSQPLELNNAFRSAALGEIVEFGSMRVCPDELITAAQRLATIQSDVGVANVTVSTSTTRIAAAAQDEVSQSLASLFSTYGLRLQGDVEKAGVIGAQQFGQRLTSAASSYSAAEASNNAILIQFEEFLAPLVTLAQTNPLEFAILLAVGPFAFAAAAPIALAFILADAFALFVLKAPYV